MVNQASIAKGLVEGVEGIRRGRVDGPYATAEELIADLHRRRNRSDHKVKLSKRGA